MSDETRRLEYEATKEALRKLCKEVSPGVFLASEEKTEEPLFGFVRIDAEVWTDGEKIYIGKDGAEELKPDGEYDKDNVVSSSRAAVEIGMSLLGDQKSGNPLEYLKKKGMP